MNRSAGQGLHIIGAGGHAKVVIETARAAGWVIAGLYDDDDAVHGEERLGVRVLGTAAEIPSGVAAVVAVGSNSARRNLASMLALDWQVVVHPHAWVSPTARIGPGTVVMAGAVVQADTQLGAHNIVNTRASIDHDCIIGEYVHIGPAAGLCGGVKVGHSSLVGVGASVIPGITIGERVTVGGGAAVVRNVPDGATVRGVPAA